MIQKQVKDIAKLAKIHLTTEEEQEIAKDLQKILDYVDKLSELNTHDIPITIHTVSIDNVLQPDLPIASIKTEESFKNAPKQQDNFFVIPNVFSNDY